jgi:hypothetical protein
VVNTLPVRVMGCVLNGITMTGVYQYYSYDREYSAQDEETAARFADGVSTREQVLPRGRS